MSTYRKTPIEGRFLHLVYSPHGSIEGVLLDAAGTRLQIVFAHHDDDSAQAFEGLADGAELVIEATLRGPSSKGEAEHAVYAFERLKSIDGEKPAKSKRPRGAAYTGVVERINYARHGAANGVVLDSGDFIHTKPDGMARLKLKVGDRVEADGDAHFLATGRGWAVEATRVNGKAVKPR